MHNPTWKRTDTTRKQIVGRNASQTTPLRNVDAFAISCQVRQVSQLREFNLTNLNACKMQGCLCMVLGKPKQKLCGAKKLDCSENAMSK